MGKKSSRRSVAKSSAASSAPAKPAYPLLAYLDGLVEKLREHIPLALTEWDEEAIHQARVATRRLKAAIDLFRPVLSVEHRRPFRRVTRKLRRRLGPLRDLDVMIGHLADLAKSARHRAAVEWLTAHLNAEREQARQASVEQAPPSKVIGKLGSWRGVREEMLEAAVAVDGLLTQSLHLQLDAFAEQADRLVCQASATGGKEPSSPPTAHQDPHELRIAGKALRYTLEMAKEHGRRLPGSVTKTFKRMQEALGLWHDHVVLTEWAMRASLDALLAHHDVALQADVLALARTTLVRSDQQLRRFATLWMQHGAGLSRTIRESFPLTRPPAAPADAAPTEPPSVPPTPPAQPASDEATATTAPDTASAA
jgi:CHAD domain-containing protein